MYHQSYYGWQNQQWAEPKYLGPPLVQLPTDGWLYLVIKTVHIGLYPPPPTVFAVDADLQVSQAYAATARSPYTTVAEQETRLLEGEVADFRCFSRHENTQWLIDIAHDLCDPVTHRGSLWIVTDQFQSLALSTYPLYATKYEYRVPPGDFLKITKKIPGLRNQVPSRSSGTPSPMRRQVGSRDARCWITNATSPVYNTHICPVRVGDAQARYIYRTFTGTNGPTENTVHDPKFGLLLDQSVSNWFKTYFLGFRYIGNNQYRVHNFYNPRVTLPAGSPWPTVKTLIPPYVNGTRVSPPNPNSPTNPPPGLFRWHYLQCVIKRFGTASYDRIEHIAMYENPPFRKGDPENDRDGPYSDEGNNPGQWSLVGGHVGRAVAAIAPEVERFAVTAPQLVTA
ncbi:hypothetical protein EV361DRAFT_276767 [Lentinula raphanica]|nr:hypothetical protein EV361DRAFT_276767 [Lentinula raphanica]